MTTDDKLRNAALVSNVNSLMNKFQSNHLPMRLQQWHLLIGKGGLRSNSEAMQSTALPATIPMPAVLTQPTADCTVPVIVSRPSVTRLSWLRLLFTC